MINYTEKDLKSKLQLIISYVTQVYYINILYYYLQIWKIYFFWVSNALSVNTSRLFGSIFTYKSIFVCFCKSGRQLL